MEFVTQHPEYRNTNKQLDLNDLKRLFFYSYFFSQGDNILQKSILLFCTKYYGIQKINKDDIEEIKKYILSSIRQLAKSNLHKDLEGDLMEKFKESIEVELDRIEDDYSKILLGGGLNLGNPIREIVVGFVMKQLEYSKWGRPNRQEFGSGVNSKDFNFFITYIIRGKRVKEEAINFMLDEIFHFIKFHFQKIPMC